MYNLSLNELLLVSYVLGVNCEQKISSISLNSQVSFNEIKNVTSMFTNIIDSKSSFTIKHSRGLAKKIEVMADYYEKNNLEKTKLIIAASLHDIGKLTIPKEILNKPGKLVDKEYQIIRRHPYYTRIFLESIKGFEEITEWASNHHEKLDGSGYPRGLTGDKLDFNSRLMSCLDIYQALTENRPYRERFSHQKSIKILREMGEEGLIDKDIVEDIDIVYESDLF